jgi:ATP phosphoribosyltransferase regulatory subunit
MPPLLEHLESLLTGTGSSLELQTFKLVDQLSGRSLGLRADTTPQAARIDAHLLNRPGVTRLCYCGPVLHTRPDGPYATREPLQFGAELFGHGGLEADLEVLQLALHVLAQSDVNQVSVDLGDARIVKALLADVPLEAAARQSLHQALAAKDISTLQRLAASLPADVGQALLRLPELYGDVSILEKGLAILAPWPQAVEALRQMQWLASHLDVPVTVDLADLRGYAYYSGARFAIYVPGASDALVRGGRYDEVGAVFGRKRPAVGFSLDLKSLVAVVPRRPLRAAIRAPWGEAPELRQAIAALRERGETVVCVLPGHESDVDEFDCDRELVHAADHWVVRAL